ncbi:MAG: hypothetical protein WA584_09495 [Pyrinomonadaceae bacterium]
MGGSRGLISAFEVHYIIDDQAESMSAQTDSTADENLLETGKHQNRSYSIAKEYSDTESASQKLKEFFNQPFFIWNKKIKTSTEKIFEELDLIANLFAHSDTKNSENSDVNISVKTGLYVRKNASVFEKDLKKLSEVYLDNKINRDEDWDGADFWLASWIGLSPEKKSNLKGKERLGLLITSIESATGIKNLHSLLVNELNSFNDAGNRDSLDWDKLAQTVIRRIKEVLQTSNPQDKLDPIQWNKTLESSGKDVYSQFYPKLREKFEEFTRSDEAFLYPEFYYEIYLIFGDDADGIWLLSKDSSVFSGVIDKIIGIAPPVKIYTDERLTEKAKEWLAKLSQNPNFSKVPAPQRREILDKINLDTWEQLKEIFSYNIKINDAKFGSAKKSISKSEQKMLADELCKWQEFRYDEKITPQLKRLTELLGESHYKIIIDTFEFVEPPLENVAGEIVVNWLAGWLVLSETDCENKEIGKNKLQSEVVRLMDLKKPDKWFEILKDAGLSIQDICYDYSANEKFVRFGLDILSNENKDADLERIEKFQGFFGHKDFSHTGIIPGIYHQVPSSLIESDKAIADAGEADEKFWNFYRRLDSDELLLKLFEKEMASDEFHVLTERIGDYHKKLYTDCLREIERITNNVPVPNFNHSIKRIKAESKDEIFAEASKTFFDKYREVKSDDERYVGMKKILSPSLGASGIKSFNEEEIFKYLFQQGRTERDLKEKFVKDQSDTESCIKKAVADFLEDVSEIRGKTFFERYLKERIKTDTPTIDRNYSPDNPARDLPSHIFASLELEAQVKLLEVLCENEEIDSVLFGELMWSEYEDAIDVAEVAAARRNKEKRKNKVIDEGHETGDNETNESPDFSPLQRAVLVFLGSINDESDTRLKNAKAYAEKIHQDDRKRSIDKNLKLWAIDTKKKDDADSPENDIEDGNNGEEEKKRFENIIRQVEIRTIDNFYLPEIFQFLDKHLNDNQTKDKTGKSLNLK